MTTEQLRKLHRAAPFQPFVIHSPDGSSLTVKHPEMMMISQGGRTAVVAADGDSFAIVDVLMITKLTFEGFPENQAQSNN
jgi:hypothetical protein